MKKMIVTIALVSLVANLFTTCIAASVLTNGDFATGNFSYWTLFTTTNGNIRQPLVVPFDITGSGNQTMTARFQVGSAVSSPLLGGGGGIYQGFVLTSPNELYFSMDAAIYSPYDNGSGGIITALLDQQVFCQWNVGHMGFGGITLYTNLSASIPAVALGQHELKIEIVRFGGAGNYTPYQYIDNISLTTIPVPEPALLPVMFLIAFALAYCKRQGVLPFLTRRGQG